MTTNNNDWMLDLHAQEAVKLRLAVAGLLASVSDETQLLAMGYDPVNIIDSMRAIEQAAYMEICRNGDQPAYFYSDGRLMCGDFSIDKYQIGNLVNRCARLDGKDIRERMTKGQELAHIVYALAQEKENFFELVATDVQDELGCLVLTKLPAGARSSDLKQRWGLEYNP